MHYRGSYIEDAPMSIEDIVLLGKLAYNMKHLDKAIEFLQVAESMALAKNDADKLKDIKYTLTTMSKKHDEVLVKNTNKNGEIRTYAKPIDAKLAKKKKFAKIKQLKPKLNVTLFTRDIEEQQMLKLFEAACRGEELRTVNNFAIIIFSFKEIP